MEEVDMKKDHEPDELLSNEGPKSLDEFFVLRDETPESELQDFLAERDLRPPERKDPFSGE